MTKMDIVEWLREEAKLVALARLNEAADEIERLRRLGHDIEKLRLEINDATSAACLAKTRLET